MSFTVIRPEDRTFEAPSWRPEEPVRRIVELTKLAGLQNSRANLWKYPPGGSGRLHIENVQEEVFLVVQGTFTIMIGDPPEPHEAPAGTLVVVKPGTPLKVTNPTAEEGLIFGYGSPPVRDAQILEDA